MMTPHTIWTEETIVKTYETDFRKRWKPACFFQAMQEAAAHHADHMGFGFEKMMDDGRIWILSRMKIIFQRFPTLQEQVFIETWPKGIQQKLFFMRDFAITGSDGQPLALATSAWILVDPRARRLLMPSSLNGQVPDNNGKAVLVEPLEKIGLPDEMRERLTAETHFSAIDLMGHVNNARYVEWICDSFSLEDWDRHELKWLQVNYVNEVRPAEKVSICTAAGAAQPGVWFAAGTNQATGQRAFEASLGWEQKPE